MILQKGDDKMKWWEKILAGLFFAFVIFCVCFVIYVYVDGYTKSTTWETETISGHIDELILYNDFPQLETYILFDSGEYVVIDINHFWAYSHLSQIQSQNNVEMTYKINGWNHKKAIQIEEIEV